MTKLTALGGSRCAAMSCAMAGGAHADARPPPMRKHQRSQQATMQAIYSALSISSLN